MHLIRINMLTFVLAEYLYIRDILVYVDKQAYSR